MKKIIEYLLDNMLLSLARAEGNMSGNMDEYNRLSTWIEGIEKYKAKEYKEAMQCFVVAIELSRGDDRGYADMLNCAGYTLTNLGDYSTAVECFKLATEYRADSALYHDNLGLSLARQGNYEEAIESFNESLRLDSKKSDSYNNRGFAKYKKGDYKEAIADFVAARKYSFCLAEIYNADNYYSRGFSESKLSNYNEAVKNFDTAIEFRKDFKEAYRGRGNCNVRLGRLEEAKEDYEKASSFSSQNDTKITNKIRRVCDAKELRGQLIGNGASQPTKASAIKPNGEEFDLSYKLIEKDDIESILDAITLQTSEPVKYLSLRGAHVSAETLKELFMTIKDLGVNGITKVNLSDNEFSNMDIVDIVGALKGSSVNELVLKNSKKSTRRLSDEIAEPLKMTNVTLIKGIELTEKLTATLVLNTDKISNTTGIIENLSGSDIEIDKVVDFREVLIALTDNNNVKKMRISNLDDLTEEKIKIISGALRCTGITELIISNCGVTDNGAAILAKGLEGRKVEILDISGNKIANEGFGEIAKVLRQAPIREINLSGNKISDWWLSSVVEEFKKNLEGGSLEKLNLENNVISKNEMKDIWGTTKIANMFADKMPNCRLTEIMGIRAEENTALTAVLKANRQCMENTSELIIAVKDRNVQIDVIRTIIDRGVDVNMPDDKGCTALLYALEYGRDDIAKLLIDNGADIDVVNNDVSQTLINVAAKNNMFDALKKVCEIIHDYYTIKNNPETIYYSKLNVVDKDGFPALYYAAKNKNAEMVDFLISQGASYVKKVVYMVEPEEVVSPFGVHGHSAVSVILNRKNELYLGKTYSFVKAKEKKSSSIQVENRNISTSSSSDGLVQEIPNIAPEKIGLLISPNSCKNDIHNVWTNPGEYTNRKLRPYYNRAVFELFSTGDLAKTFNRIERGFLLEKKAQEFTKNPGWYSREFRNCKHISAEILKEAIKDVNLDSGLTPNQLFQSIKLEVERCRLGNISVLEAQEKLKEKYDLRL